MARPPQTEVGLSIRNTLASVLTIAAVSGFFVGILMTRMEIGFSSLNSTMQEIKTELREMNSWLKDFSVKIENRLTKLENK